MANITTVYWRDIPAQIIVKAGRKNAKRQLSQRFHEAIDIAAMRSKAHESDAYLEEWRKGSPVECSNDLEKEADVAAEQLEAQYSDEQLETIAKNGGHAIG